MTAAAMLPGVKPESHIRTRWFSTTGAVRRRDDGVFEVTVAGVCIGRYGRSEPGQRNLLLVALAENPDIRLADLAFAFGITTERLRQIRQVAREQGANALLVRPRIGRAPLSEHVRKRLVALFEAGLKIDEAYARVKRSTSRASVGRVYKAWRTSTRTAAAAPAIPAPKQLSLLPESEAETEPTEEREAVPRAVRRRERRASREVRTVPIAEDSLAVGHHHISHVQHVGTWLMVGVLHANGLYDVAEEVRSVHLAPDDLRTAIDATVMALTLGQKCVEGVRRLATPSASTLLFRVAPPSEKWTREVLHHFAPDGAAPLHLVRAACHAKSLAATSPRRVVVYVDNHLRKYTGKHTIRKGWHMQEKRVVPGVTDYYVHDDGGRPLFRVEKVDHAPLVDVLRPIARFLRSHVGAQRPLLLVFDRGGSFPEEMAAIRNEGFEFVTYPDFVSLRLRLGTEAPVITGT